MANVIIVEDDEVLGPLLRDVLIQADHAVRLFTTSSEGIEAFTQEPADIVIADIIIRVDGDVMPDGGISLIFRLKNLAKAKGLTLSIIAISGTIYNKGMQNVLEIARCIGADLALAKPFDPEKLLEAVDQLLVAQM